MPCPESILKEILYLCRRKVAEVERNSVNLSNTK